MPKVRYYLLPFIYAGAAICSALVLPRVEATLFPHSTVSISVNAALAIDSAVASGMMALTGMSSRWFS